MDTIDGNDNTNPLYGTSLPILTPSLFNDSINCFSDILDAILINLLDLLIDSNALCCWYDSRLMSMLIVVNKLFDDMIQLD